ncbi:unnamed protein product [Staurois parvus]|uniref:Uncharacterized protein n=1 Tax=Staurois parvus TaxID=386267 RepID=A0ABN9C7J3_9NEOB|nr:unnamed protein product [Staurois parvus]
MAKSLRIVSNLFPECKLHFKAGADWPFGNSGTAQGPGVSRGPHEMPLVPFFIGFFEFGQGHRGPMIPYCPGAP